MKARDIITVSDVAREAGVSISTVSNVLNHAHKVSPDTRERVQRVIERLHYTPDMNASTLKMGQRRVVGLFLSTIQGTFNSVLTQTVHLCCTRAGYRLNIYIANHPGESELFSMIISSGVTGALVMNGDINEPYISQLQRANVPTVFLDRPYAGTRLSGVFIDNEQAVSMGMEYLIAQGHRRIGFFRGTDCRDGRERLQFYQRAMDAHALPIDPDIVLSGGFSAAVAFTETQRMLAAHIKPPDAFFCANDEMACGCMRALLQHGLRVPGDVSVMGFDDFEMSAYYTPPLTTIHSPMADVGETGLRELVRLIENPDALGTVRRMPATLVVRESCAARDIIFK